MLNIPGYKIQAKIHESSHSEIYRGFRELDREPVIFKVLKKSYPSPEEIIRYKLEYMITRSLSSNGIIRVYELQPHHRTFAIVMEDFGGESLANIIAKNRFTCNDFLEISIQITDSLMYIHAAHIIHKDINPSNIVFNSTTRQLKIIDFGISTDLSQQILPLKHPAALEGTLAYVSPEQTGRMNRSLDYRTDYYSLGATFYQLLTGQLPFTTRGPLELLHYHLALQPIPPHEIDPTIPAMVSAIIMKLLAKTTEDRYQSAQGISADLERCRLELSQKGEIAPFSLAQHDIVDQFHLPEKLYGREPEIAALLAAFARVVRHGLSSDDAAPITELVLVSGYSGVGKSALVQELYKPITQQRGHFTAGKFDQYQRTIPYFAIAQAFQVLIKQLLTESDEQLRQWRTRLLAVLGQNSQVLMQVIPALELIVGPQPAVPALSPPEAHNRFNQVFLNFIHAFAQPDHPLVIFLDDLQWADSASLKLIELLATEAGDRTLLLIGTYRDNEVDATHPLLRTVDAIEHAGGRVSHLALAPLSLPNVHQLLADTLHCPPMAALQLAELVLQKTGGNPFFINAFLRSLHAEGFIAFQQQTRSWQWSIAQIQAGESTDNVVDLLAGQIQKLSAQTDRIVSLAACIGYRFDLATLADVAGYSHWAIAQALRAAIAAGLVVPLSNAHISAELDVALPPNYPAIEYRFAHDRVQQAAYSLIPVADRSGLHWDVGQCLLRMTPPDQQERRLFDITNQLNQGKDVMQQQADRDTLALLNLRAGKQAQAAAAYEAAFGYLQIALAALAADSWQTNYPFTLDVYSTAAELAYLNGDFTQMEQLSATVLNHASSILDSINIYEVRVQALSAQGQLVEALQLTLDILAFLDIHFPKQATPADVQHAMAETQAQLGGRTVAGLIELPLMTDQRMLAAMRLLSSAISASHAADPLLFSLIVLKQVSLSIEYGNAPISPFSYAVYGLILCGAAREIDYGYQFSQLGLQLLDRLDARQIRAKVLLSVHAGTQYWKEHLRETFRPLEACYQAGIDNGDFEFSGLTALHHCDQAYFAGLALPDLAAMMTAYRDHLVRMKQLRNADAIGIFQQAVLNLTTATIDPGVLRGDAYDEAVQLPLLQQANDRQVLFLLHLNKLILSYLFQQYDQAIAAAQITATYLDGVAGQASIVLFRFYDSLARLAVYPEASPAQQAELLQQVAENQVLMQLWSEHAPMNYLHKWQLVAAEQHRVLGQVLEAIEGYDRAIALARENQYLQEEALANECASRFHFGRSNLLVARAYFQEARYTYLGWGASAKVQDLDTRYPTLHIQQNEARRLLTDTTTGDNRHLETLDLTTVLKASQAIASEIVLDRLLDSLMTILIEHAGAQTGYMVLPDAGAFSIAAMKSVSAATTIAPAEPLVHTGRDATVPLPASIINYVANTRERLVLKHAAMEGGFTTDPWIVLHQSKSVLCAPLLHQGQLIGIILLENNLAIGAFTPERMAVLNLLTAQAAISISNAQLLHQQTDLNRALQAEIDGRKRTASDRDRLIAILEASTDYVGISNTQGKVLWRNESLRKLVGTHPNGAAADVSIPTYHPTWAWDIIQQQGLPTALRAGTWVGETAVVDSNGREIPTSQLIIAHNGVDGQIEYFSTILRDITALKQAEARLRLLESVVVNARDAVIVTEVSPLDYPGPRIRYVNDAFIRITGYTAEEVIGGCPRILQGPQTAPQTRAAIRAALQACEPIETEILNYTKAGAPMWIDLSIVPVMDNEGQLSHFVGIQRDITEQKQLQARLLQAQRLESIGRLASGIAHDFNNLLTVIGGYTDMVRESIATDSTIYPDVLEIRNATERATALTRQLLTFARQQAHQPQIVPVNTLIERLAKLLQRLLGTDISLHLDLAPHLPAIAVDPNQIEQVLVNLAVNAHDAMQSGGTLVIRTEVARVDVQDSALASADTSTRPVRILITDTGTGMSQEVQSHAFEPFFTTKPIGQGTGLGLAICYGIVLQNGGTIEIVSQLGVGTTMIVSFPAALEAGGPQDEQLAQPAASGGRETILVVDDMPVVCALASRILSAAGYIVLTAGSGALALALLRDGAAPQVRIVLTDVQMPEMNGWMLAAEIIENYPDIRVIYMSGNFAAVPESSDTPRGTMITKPFSAAVLLHAIRSTLDAEALNIDGNL